jgi:hemerythrin superfamily protein
MSRDAIEVLEKDHREVESLFEEVKAGSGGKDDVVEQIVRELSVHDAIERELLYPAVRDRIASHEGEGLAEHSLDEHEEVAELLSQIESTDDTTQRDVLLQRLIANVADHVGEEENEIFPQLRQAMSEAELTELGSKLEAAKGRAPTHPHPHAPRSGVGAKVGGGAAAAMDKVRDATR